jgi:hypothetical protein
MRHRITCHNCEKSFPNSKMYDSHCRQHVQCEFCPFQASKRIVREHQKATHGEEAEPEYKPFVVRMESPEEIERWISERRRRFPTQDNIQRKVNQQISRMLFMMIYSLSFF